jgi:hypothetical protein
VFGSHIRIEMIRARGRSSVYLTADDALEEYLIKIIVPLFTLFILMASKVIHHP